MGDPNDLINPYGATGSRFILNNTSYSGVDIKIVVHMYDAAHALQNQIKDLQLQLKKDEARSISVNRRISKNLTTAQAAHFGTRKMQYAQQALSNLYEERVRLQDSIQAGHARLSSLTKQSPQISTKVLAEAQSLSMSIYRDKQAVRACGSVYPKGFTRGPREIAGTMIFTVFDEHVLHKFLSAHASDFDAGGGLSSALMDQLPPVDITVAFANEFGSLSRLAILGVEFVDEGQTMSIEDIITENVVSFVARDIDPMRGVGQRMLDEESRMVQSFTAKRASDLLLEEDYQHVKGALDPFERFRSRRNPFL